MPVFAEGSTTKIPAHSEETMPWVAAIADILSDPDVCWVSLLSSAGCTTLMVDGAVDFVACALGRDNLGIAIFPLNREHIFSYRVDEPICFHTLMCFAIASRRRYCTLQYS